MKKTEASLLIEHHLNELGLTPWEAEYRFHPTRKWRFDYAVPRVMLAIEIEGGVWVGGGHVRGKYYEENCRKYSIATGMGWRLFRFTPEMISVGESKEILKGAA